MCDWELRWCDRQSSPGIKHRRKALLSEHGTRLRVLLAARIESRQMAKMHVLAYLS